MELPDGHHGPLRRISARTRAVAQPDQRSDLCASARPACRHSIQPRRRRRPLAFRVALQSPGALPLSQSAAAQRRRHRSGTEPRLHRAVRAFANRPCRHRSDGRDVGQRRAALPRGGGAGCKGRHRIRDHRSAHGRAVGFETGSKFSHQDRPAAGGSRGQQNVRFWRGSHRRSRQRSVRTIARGRLGAWARLRKATITTPSITRSNWHCSRASTAC